MEKSRNNSNIAWRKAEIIPTSEEDDDEEEDTVKEEDAKDAEDESKPKVIESAGGEV